ncbi:MAG: hypothetical protein KAT90_01140, partial [Gammaproteobacteria bacterium]|nr:hypothetical protein [Gammaproteobacteria bacterium]
MQAMFFVQRSCLFLFVFAIFFVNDNAIAAFEFQPGAGIGAKYTDNARTEPDNTVDDLITVGNVSASIYGDDGPLKYDVMTLFSDHRYTQDTYADQHYLNLTGDVDWEMIKHRFNWKLSDYFTQRTVNSLNSDTPDNLQDSNIFSIGADIRLPFSERNNLSISPIYSQYYYEELETDNKQYSLAVNWNYQMSRLTSVGLNLNARKINYTETNSLGQSINGTIFSGFGLIISSQRLHSSYSANIGATSVKRDGGYETSGFSGFLRWRSDLTARSTLQAQASTDLTDTSSVALNDDTDSTSVNNNVQISASIIRNSDVSISYLRDDTFLRTNISARYHKIEYSNEPLNRNIQSFDVDLRYPITQLLSGGLYTNYDYTEQLDTNRLDKGINVGANLRYNFSRKLQGLFD